MLGLVYQIPVEDAVVYHRGRCRVVGVVVVRQHGLGGGIGGERAAVYFQASDVSGVIAVRRIEQNSRGGFAGGLERAVIDGGLAPVHDYVLGRVVEVAIVDGEVAVIVILDGVDAAAERAAIDGHFSGTFSGVLAAVADHAGEVTSVFHRCTRTEAHGAIVFNGVVAVAATVVAVLAGFLAAHERATLKRGRCAYCVGESSLCMGDVVNHAAANGVRYRERSIVGDGVTCLVGELLTV